MPDWLKVVTLILAVIGASVVYALFSKTIIQPIFGEGNDIFFFIAVLFVVLLVLGLWSEFRSSRKDRSTK